MLVQLLSDVRAETSKGYLVQVAVSDFDAGSLERLGKLLAHADYTGKVPVKLAIETDDACRVQLGLPARIDPSDELAYQIKRIFNGAATVKTL